MVDTRRGWSVGSALFFVSGDVDGSKAGRAGVNLYRARRWRPLDNLVKISAKFKRAGVLEKITGEPRYRRRPRERLSGRDGAEGRRNTRPRDETRSNRLSAPLRA